MHRPLPPLLFVGEEIRLDEGEEAMAEVRVDLEQ
jgi:hypothetical protein